MAEFALGLTKTAVQGTLNRVKSALEEETRLRVRVQDDLVFITGEFEMMQSFLSTSEGRASQDQVVRTWVRQLRDLAFDVEDCVEFVIHLDKASRWDWVRRLTSSLICLASPPLPLDEAVVEIKRLKVRVEDLSHRNTRYNLFSSGGESSSDQQQLTHVAGCTTTTSSTPATTEVFHILREVWEAMGKLIPTNGELKRLIDCEGSELKVISLWQSPQADVVGELGWVTIAKKAYDDPEICQEFKNNRVWVKLSTHHPFNPIEFLNKLLSQFTKSHPHHHHHDDITELMLQVSQHRYLIVLETELSSVADWDAIRTCLLDGNNGSRIIVSTKHLGIALLCTGQPYQVSELKHFFHDRYICAIFPKGCGHRIGMGEFFWRLRPQGGVISLFWRTEQEKTRLKCKLFRKLRVFNGVKFEYCFFVTVCKVFKLVDLAHNILVQSAQSKGKQEIIEEESEYEESEDEESSEDEEKNVDQQQYRLQYAFQIQSVVKQECDLEQLTGMNEHDIIERCRKFLAEHDCLLCIDNLQSPAEWGLIREHLLCEPTRGCTVVITSKRSVAAQCVDHEQHRILNIRDLVYKGSRQQGQSGHADAGGNIKKDGNFELINTLVGRGDDDDFFDERYAGRTWSVWGIAGVGKSALVRKYYNRRMSKKKNGTYGWVDVPHPFNLTDLCQRLLLDLCSDDLEAKEAAAIGMMEGQDSIQECCKILRGNKGVLVFDGLRSAHDWDLIKTSLLSQATRCTPIVITREEIVATHCATGRIHNVKGLQSDAAFDLFTKIIFDGKPLFPEAEAYLKLMISRCGGLPEVIVAIRKNLKPADETSLFLGIFDLFGGEFMEKLQTLSMFPSLRGLFCWMQSYFDICPDELKPCIFYMSVFPADQSIRLRRLFRRWIAEGYLSGGTAEEKGANFMEELFKLSILCIEGGASPSSFKLNGFFREYIKSRPMEDNRVFELDGSCSPSPRLTGQHLTISSSWDRDEIVFKSLDLSRLRSLTVYGDWRSFLICDKMKLLRVLDLEGSASTSDSAASVTDDDLEQIGKLLPRLKFMSLRGCMLITCLPDSLGAMRQLETLDAKHTSIVELPPAIITKLHKLQYFRVGTTKSAPTGTSSIPQTPAPTETSSPPQTPAPTGTSSPPQTPAPTGTSSPPQTPQEHSHDGTGPSLGAKAPLSAMVQSASTGAWKNMVSDLQESCGSWLQSKNQRRRSRVALNGGGVKVARAGAEGIGQLTDLHTLGVVNVAGGKGSLLFLKELKKLTQLRKLKLCGITRKNWQKLCFAISGHRHLESLSLQLLLLEEQGNYDFACFDSISEPPKTLERLKVLYTTNVGAGGGGARISPIWIKQLSDTVAFDHELTLSRQDDIDFLHGEPMIAHEYRFRLKPTEQHLSFNDWLPMGSIRIDCSSISSTVTFGDEGIVGDEELNIRCCSSCGSLSCMRIVGLKHIFALEQVFVTGPCSDEFKEDLLKQLDEHENKPKLRLL